jgi:hypothetical protein
MKILLLSAPRTGSTYLCNIFKGALPRYTVVIEPWVCNSSQLNFCDKNRFDPTFNHLNYDNILVNTHISDLIYAYPKMYKDIIDSFDWVIKLTRNDLFEQVLSYAIARQSNVFLITNNQLPKVEIKLETFLKAYFSIVSANIYFDLIEIPNAKKIVYEDLTLNPKIDLNIFGIPGVDIKLASYKSPPKNETVINYNECVSWFETLMEDNLDREKRMML